MGVGFLIPTGIEGGNEGEVERQGMENPPIAMPNDFFFFLVNA